MLVAPASRLFSTNSFTAVPRFSTTCPEQIRCTDLRSMGLMALAGCRLDGEEGTTVKHAAKAHGPAQPSPTRQLLPKCQAGYPERPYPNAGRPRSRTRSPGRSGGEAGAKEPEAAEEAAATTATGVLSAAGQRDPEPPVRGSQSRALQVSAAPTAAARRAEAGSKAGTHPDAASSIGPRCRRLRVPSRRLRPRSATGH